MSDAMKLSEALYKASAANIQQIVDEYQLPTFAGEPLQMCAIGAMFYVLTSIEPLHSPDVPDLINGKIDESHKSFLADDYAAECPACPLCGVSVISIMTHLNDNHRWTFAQIAEWLEGHGL